jgi:hypothetical protein
VRARAVPHVYRVPDVTIAYECSRSAFRD